MEASTKNPLIITDKEQMRKWSRTMRSQGKTIGFAPSMGSLHEGHLSLVKEAFKHADVTVVSIYLNPGQFATSEDFYTYPSDFHGDMIKLMSLPGRIDVVFHPYSLYDGEKDMKNASGNDTSAGVSKNLEGKGKVVSCLEEGGAGHDTWVRVEKLEKGLCGKSRPLQFRGAATVIAKLFNIVEPDVAVVGKKDYQQWRILQRMARDLDFSVRIIGLETVRDNDGLALSSRNVLLSAKEREKALSISRSLLGAKSSAANGHINCRELRDSVIQAISEAGGRIDYAEIVDQESLQSVEEIKSPVVFCVAARFGNIRLIDNIEINL